MVWNSSSMGKIRKETPRDQPGKQGAITASGSSAMRRTSWPSPLLGKDPHREHSMILTLPAVVAGDARIPERRCRCPWHSEAPTVASYSSHTTRLPSACVAHDQCTCSTTRPHRCPTAIPRGATADRASDRDGCGDSPRHGPSLWPPPLHEPACVARRPAPTPLCPHRAA
jgi:hypothetical protein